MMKIKSLSHVFFFCALPILLSQKFSCSPKREKKNTYNVYLKANTKALSLLCFQKEDLERVIEEPAQLGFLANDGKCFLQEKSRELRVIGRPEPSDKFKFYKVSLENLKQEAYIVREQLTFTELWRRIFIPKERFISKCKTNEECEERLIKLEKQEEESEKIYDPMKNVEDASPQKR